MIICEQQTNSYTVLPTRRQTINISD
jgi:hypothetical protein